MQFALKVFNLRLVRRNRFDRLCGVLDARITETGWLVRDIPNWYEPVVSEWVTMRVTPEVPVAATVTGTVTRLHVIWRSPH